MDRRDPVQTRLLVSRSWPCILEYEGARRLTALVFTHTAQPARRKRKGKWKKKTKEEAVSSLREKRAFNLFWKIGCGICGGRHKE